MTLVGVPEKGSQLYCHLQYEIKGWMFHHCKVQEKVHCHQWFSATGAGNHSEVHEVIKKQDFVGSLVLVCFSASK